MPTANKVTRLVYERIHELKDKGHSLRQIARQLKLDHTTISSWLSRPTYAEDDFGIETAGYRSEILNLRNLLKENQEQLYKQSEIKSLIHGIADHKIRVPDWIRPQASKSNKRAIVTAMLSDLHLDEVVRPEQVNYV